MYKYIKRLLDIFISIFLIILTFIPMSIVAICIKLEDGGKVIFKQKRVGKNLKTFNIYKFRSMTENREALDGKLTHEQMVTNVGKFIRKTSLDELPQLFNILKGEMSFIGPRPWIVDYYTWMNDKQKRRACVRPGITGLAQVNGRNGIGIHRKIEYDLEYINHFGFVQDIKILIDTIRVVLLKKDAEISETGIKEELNALKAKNKKKIKLF